MIVELAVFVLLAWLLTYAVHSTILLGATWFATRGSFIRSDKLRERLWKVAALGGIVTATLQLSTGWKPYAGVWALRDGAPLDADRGSARGPCRYDRGSRYASSGVVFRPGGGVCR